MLINKVCFLKRCPNHKVGLDRNHSRNSSIYMHNVQKIYVLPVHVKYKSNLLLHEGDQIICRPSTLVIKGLLTISKSSKHFITVITLKHLFFHCQCTNFKFKGIIIKVTSKEEMNALFKEFIVHVYDFKLQFLR